MAASLRVLHLEDNSNDAELVQNLLVENGIDCAIVRVETREAFESALATDGFDLILSDYHLPSFDGLTALAIAQQKAPDIPYIFISGTLGEDAAVGTLQRSATDFVIKSRMGRLPGAVRRALREAENRAERRKAEQALRESEMRHRLVTRAT